MNLVAKGKAVDMQTCICGARLDAGFEKCPRCGAQTQGPQPAFVEEAQVEELCPECGASIAFKEGCKACTNLACGWSLCS